MRISALLLAAVMLVRCAAIIPNSSSVTFKNVDAETNISAIGLNFKVADMPDEKFKQIGKGECKGKIKNNRPITIVQAEKAGYKMKNFVMYKTKINPLFFVDIPFAIVFLGIPLIEMSGKFHLKYDKTYELTSLTKLPSKTSKESFLHVDAIAVDMKSEDFSVVRVSKASELVNHVPFSKSGGANNELGAVENQRSELIENANGYLDQWGYTTKDNKRNVLQLNGRVKKMEFLFFQGFLSVGMLCEWKVTNTLSGTEVFKKEFTSRSNYYKLFSAGYTVKSKVFDASLNKSVDDVFETSMIELLNDPDYLAASNKLSEMVSVADVSVKAVISEPKTAVKDLASVSNAVVLIKCDKAFASATLFGSEGYAITSLDLLTNKVSVQEGWFEDGSKSGFEMIQSNPDHNLALIKFKSIPNSGGTFSLKTGAAKAQIGDEIYLVSKNMNDTKMNGSTIKGMISSSYAKKDIAQYQMDVSYSKWNDGSPVVDSNGKLIGISLSPIGADKSATATVMAFESIQKIFNLEIK